MNEFMNGSHFQRIGFGMLSQSEQTKQWNSNPIRTNAIKKLASVSLQFVLFPLCEPSRFRKIKVFGRSRKLTGRILKNDNNIARLQQPLIYVLFLLILMLEQSIPNNNNERNKRTNKMTNGRKEIIIKEKSIVEVIGYWVVLYTDRTG